MTIDQLRAILKKMQEEVSDGFDEAFILGAEHVIEECGDGGLSEQYIAGLRFALAKLDVEEIGGQ